MRSYEAAARTWYSWGRRVDTSLDGLTPMPKHPPTTATIERRLEDPPVIVRSVLERVGADHVRILDYRRRRPHETRFTRVRAMEGRVVPFEQLQLDQSFDALFPQRGLFDDPTATTAAASMDLPRRRRPRRRGRPPER